MRKYSVQQVVLHAAARVSAFQFQLDVHTRHDSYAEEACPGHCIQQTLFIYRQEHLLSFAAGHYAVTKFNLLLQAMPSWSSTLAFATCTGFRNLI